MQLADAGGQVLQLPLGDLVIPFVAGVDVGLSEQLEVAFLFFGSAGKDGEEVGVLAAGVLVQLFQVVQLRFIAGEG